MTLSIELLSQLKTLKERRNALCKSFAKKCTTNPKTSWLFKKTSRKLRSGKAFMEPLTKSKGAFKGCIPHLTRLLNQSEFQFQHNTSMYNNWLLLP